MDIEELRPTKRFAIMDLVAEVGIDTTLWHENKIGGTIKTPRANPRYCYNWSFGGYGEPIAVCIWHKGISIDNNEIVSGGNLRKAGDKHRRNSQDVDLPKGARISAQLKARRAYEFDEQIHEAFLRRAPVRTVITEGIDDQVHYRRLDAVPWYVESYDSAGKYRVVRGQRQLNETVVFVDQFSSQDTVRRRELSNSAFERSRVIRAKVLARAGGYCEYCGERGFKTDSGGIYLETHHIIPLSEGGSDREVNVIAICANDHRRAHSGEDHRELRKEFQVRVRVIS